MIRVHYIGGNLHGQSEDFRPGETFSAHRSFYYTDNSLAPESSPEGSTKLCRYRLQALRQGDDVYYIYVDLRISKLIPFLLQLPLPPCANTTLTAT